MLDVSSESPFFQAIAKGDTHKVYRMLKQYPELANTLSTSSSSPLAFRISPENPISPLMFAASLGHNDIIDLLCTANANLNFVDNEGQTALLQAIRFGKTKTVDHLLHYYGLDLRQNNIHGFSALLTALWAMQPNMALFLVQYYLDQTNLHDSSNNAFANTLNSLYQLQSFDQDKVIQDYSGQPATRYDSGLKVADLLNERFLQAQANFKSTLVRMLNNQEEERVSSEFVDFMRGLRHNVESATTLEPIEAVVNEISKSVYFAGSTKAKLKEELSTLNSYQELIQLFNIALSLQQSMQQQDREKLQDQLTAIPPQRLAQLLYWPEISSMIAGSPYIVERLFQYAFEKRDIGVLTKLLEERVVSTDRVLTSLQDPDCTDEDLLFCYISLALAGFEDSVLLLQNNFEVFQSAIEKMRDGFYGDIAQWLFVHHQIHVGLEDASEHDRALSNKMVFSELLKLSDRDHSKIIMLQKFGEIVSQTGKGFNGQYSALKTPFLLLLEMFGESIFTQSQDTYLFQRTTYLPLASARIAQDNKDESIKPESDIEVTSSALRQRKLKY